jgi:hypothetical protein
MAVGNSYNPDRVRARHIRDVMRKDPQIYSTIASRSQARQLGILHDPVYRCDHLIAKAHSESRLFCFVVTNGLPRTRARLRQAL